ncbi:LytR family transcriptional regulator [Selenomonas sp. WCA-380-WT-3B 3/]|uniref:LytR family transcriptional regulator n=3 Tax=Selenomonas montiformis TaxID=2652285 RepID=A0A6I2UXT2_9FIRM|nr:LytR family transcriptional regulator [Selenomonas montiformis]
MRQKRRKRSYKRLWQAGILFMVILAAGLGLFFGKMQNGTLPGQDGDGKNRIVHVMILGVDRRADDAGRSDTMMIASLDPDKETASLLSVPRDTRVKIDGHGYEKINHAYAYGGHELSQKAVEQLLGEKIDHYILIDTRSFARIIDAMGGVDIQVEKRMYYEDPWDDNGGLVIDLYPGKQHMDGAKAIQYVRYRDGEGDIGRIGRQQKFVKACLNQLISPEMLPKLPNLVEEIRSVLETDMSLPELLQYAHLLKSVHDHGLTAQMVPGQPGYLKDVSYWIPDITDLRKMVMEELGLDFSAEAEEKAKADEAEYMKSLPKDMQVLAQSKNNGTIRDDGAQAEQEGDAAAPMEPSQISVMVINDSGINGAGAKVAGVLQRKGFMISGVETGRTSSRQHTTIVTSKRNTDVFYGMPFRCVIMDGGSSNQAVVHIGLDYRP